MLRLLAPTLFLVVTGCPEFPLSLLDEPDVTRPPDAVRPDTVAADGATLEAMKPDTAAPDAASDTAAPDTLAPDTAAPDMAAPDTATPDTLSPDMLSPDILSPDILSPDILSPDLGPPYYINETFTSSMGQVTPQTGSWSLVSGQLQQSDNSYNGYYATADVPVNDYLAETRLTIYNLPSDPWTQGAGLGVRVQPGAVGQYPPAMYVCVISPDDNILGIVKCPGGPTFDCNQPPVKKTVAIQLNVAYRMTMRAQGGTMTCSLPDLGQSVVLNDSSYAAGGVALATFQTRTRFDYLKVGPP
jgi:hypothetical protein